MLHSKATAALMKLKEIDRKYKMKTNEELKARQRPSLSDISAVDSIDEISMSSVVVAPPGSGDSPKVIPRPKLDIRMPEAHMERAETRRIAAGVDVIEPPVELVTIFDKSEKNSPRFSLKGTSRGKVAEKREVGPAGEGNDAVSANPEISSSTLQGSSFNEESGANTETSISEDVQEVVSSIPQTSLSKSNRDIASLGEETSPKSIYSIINGEEDPSASVTSNTYSDDFVKTVSQVGSLDETLPPSENAEKSMIGPRANIMVDSAAEVQESRSSPRAKHVTGTSPVPQTTEFRGKEIVELIAPKIMPRVISKCETNLDPALSDYVKMIERRASGNEEFERVADGSDRTLSRSSQAASARSTRKRRGRKGKPRAVSSRDSQTLISRELTSSLEHRTESTTPRDLESQNLSRSRKAQDLKEEHRKGNADAPVPLNPKEEITKTITRRKIASKVKTESTKNRTRIEAPRSAEPASGYFNDYGKTQKSEPTIEPVPVTMVGLASLGDDRYKLRISQRQKGYSKKLENEENVCSKHPIKRGGFDNRKNRTKKKSRSSKEESDRPGRIGMKELRQREERYQLRARVRGYIQQIIDERERLLVSDGFRVPVEKRPCNHSARRLRQSESPPRYFFKPLDLPNIAAFKRPDFGEDDAADQNQIEEYKNLRAIRDRVFGIRHWLKQQFVLYKDYSNLASIINEKYAPVTLTETKKMISDMQRYYGDSDMCSYCHQLR